LLQTSVPLHAVVHVPQCFGSLRTSTHWPPQAICWPLVHVTRAPLSDASDDASVGPPDDELLELDVPPLLDDVPPLLDDVAPDDDEEEPS
jgi:hypothetical protein